jgi:alpha-L-fucosidase
LETLEKWQDLKFGVIIHWGLYAHLDCEESWGLSADNIYKWKQPLDTISYKSYKEYYWSAKDIWNPKDFNPRQWADVAKAAGMKYLIFTTKHHDGFCMFDTKQTDYSIMNGAFGSNPKANVTKEIFNAFRDNDFLIGAYFSKPDWHSQYYWWDEFFTTDRNVNYDIQLYPERWDEFKHYTFNQVKELMIGDYGKIDIIWLDGAWVCSPQQDVNIPHIAEMARSYNPYLLIVDRYGEAGYENYDTYEQQTPNKQLLTPWENCITLGNAWGYQSRDDLKSATKVIHTLIEIVAKGGNYVLGVGPDANGVLPVGVIERLAQTGEWLNNNGDAIYCTRPTPFYHDSTSNTWFTQSKDGQKIYAIVCFPENSPLPAKVVWKCNEPESGSVVKCLQTNTDVEWKKTGSGTEVTLPVGLPSNLPAIAFETLKSERSAMLPVNTIKIWSADGTIMVYNNSTHTYIRIFNLTGRLLLQQETTSGIIRIPFPKGTYIVEFGDIVQKVIVH